MEIIGRLTLVYNKFANTNKCINFKSKEQEDLLISQFPVKENLDSNIFMQDGDTILVPLNYEECIKYNYCYFNNKVNNLEKKRYFCYITNYQYVEPNVTRITIAVDTLQTFLFDIDKFRGNIERCHSARRINVSTTETPRYIINPDLYFMEDEVSENYVAKDSKEGNNIPPYLVLTFAIPFAETDKVVQGCINKLGHYCEKIPEGSTWFGAAVVGISFPDPTGLGCNVKSIGGTQLYSIVLSARNNYTSATYRPTMSLEYFRNRYPVLMDKIVDAFFIDNPRHATLKEQSMWTGSQTILDIIFDEDNVSFVTELNGALYFFNDTRETFQRKRIDVENDSINPSKWVNKDVDELTTRLIEQEKKLDLYPYSFVKVTLMNNDFIWKYQEQYKFLVSDLGLDRYVYSFVSWFDITSPNPTMNTSMLFDYNNLVKLSNADLIDLADINTNDKELMQYFTQYDNGMPLPSISIYQEKYTQYLNYQKAIVDANNTINTIGAIAGSVSGSVTTRSPSGSYRYTDPHTTYGFKQKAVHYPSGNRIKKLYNQQFWGGYSTSQYNSGSTQTSIGFGGAGGIVGAIGNYVTTALNESAIKSQPMSVLHSGSGNDQLFTNLYKSNGNILEYFICKYEPKDNLKSIYEQKFYNYGYHIPVDVELTKAEFFNIISNREYFCYMEWNSLELESDETHRVPTIYVNDIIARLTSGVRFENTSDDDLFPNYSINSNNKEVVIPAKPFFVKNY